MDQQKHYKELEKALETPDFEPHGCVREGDVPEPKHAEPEPMPPIMPVE